MSIKLITFDLDDTLWDNVPVIISAEASMREWLAINAAKVGDLPLEHFASLRLQVLERYPELKHRISILRQRVLTHAFEEAGYPQPEATEMADVCFEAFIHARHQLTPFPEAEPMLRALHQHFLLGVITNGNADVQRVGLRTTSTLPCALKTSASPSRMRDCFRKPYNAVAWTPARRCILAIIRGMTLPGHSRRGFGRCGSTRRVRCGKPTSARMRRFAA